MSADVERALELLSLLDSDLKAAGDRYFTSAFVRGRLRPIRAALHGTDDGVATADTPDEPDTPSMLDLLGGTA